uniref:Uncharacterized protein n=1 Tax=Anguilla anguilla TaxID=7936 RepID=A0A0E9UBE7_ANGAN
MGASQLHKAYSLSSLMRGLLIWKPRTSFRISAFNRASYNRYFKKV